MRLKWTNLHGESPNTFFSFLHQLPMPANLQIRVCTCRQFQDENVPCQPSFISIFERVLRLAYVMNETWTRGGYPLVTYRIAMDPMHLYLRAIFYLGKITREIYWFYL